MATQHRTHCIPLGGSDESIDKVTAIIKQQRFVVNRNKTIKQLFGNRIIFLTMHQLQTDVGILHRVNLGKQRRKNETAIILVRDP